MMFYCEECDRTLDGDYVEAEDYKGKIICLDCYVEKLDDYYKFALATGKYTVNQARIEANNYMKMQNKFYGGKR